MKDATFALPRRPLAAEDGRLGFSIVNRTGKTHQSSHLILVIYPLNRIIFELNTNIGAIAMVSGKIVTASGKSTAGKDAPVVSSEAFQRKAA